MQRRPEKTSVALVVSPLSALMRDQKTRFVPSGISAEFLGELQHDDLAIKRVRDGEHQLVFVTPENLGHSRLLDLLMQAFCDSGYT